jgi:anthranilate synthase component 1
LADTLTPVNIYLTLRDVFAGSILLESSDYHGNENALSIVCCEPIASFSVSGHVLKCRYPGQPSLTKELKSDTSVQHELRSFIESFEIVGHQENKLPGNGLFGYVCYDAARYFDGIEIPVDPTSIPDLMYKLYRFVIVVDHFRNELTLFENSDSESQATRLDTIQQTIFSNRFSTYNFQGENNETSNISDEQYRELVKKGISHCQRGDVFQLVLSRRFSSSFKGDEFNVYRSLRSINPSPYLFYFDFGSFKLFGSSPEAQLQVRNRVASIYPIAGTFKRTGNDLEDAQLASRLSEDEKENAEHIMLVDLARNDMSRHGEEVTVEVFKEIQYYSHVIHLVSKVTGKLKGDSSVIEVAADTFPAGTLSGAPKHMAMTLINKYENINRGFYGGAIGYIGFNGDYNHAIMIRTFLSAKNTLTYQAGAGIVAKSIPENELQEVNNKLGALRNAIKLAEKI